MTTLGDLCYKRNFLRQVIARVDFVGPLAAIATSLPAQLSQQILKRYPISEPAKAIAQELQISPEQEVVAAKRTEHTIWTFYSKERDRKLTLQPEALLLEVGQYRTFELMKDDFVAMAGALFAVAKDAQPSRLGLRYINVIELDGDKPFDWDGLLNAQMLSLFKFPLEPDRSSIARAFHNLELALGDFNLRYQFGMHNPDYPAKIRRRAFVLDLDGYAQGALNKAEIEQLLDTFHSKIQEYFEFSITDALRERMNA